MTQLKIVCTGGCEGTGLYHGFAEPPVTYVICSTCGGTGYEIVKPFKKRKLIKNVPRRTIKVRTWDNNILSYSEFLAHEKGVKK